MADLTPTPDALPRAPIPGVFGRALAWLYLRELARRNRAYDARRGVVELDRPVISIGNLSVGGTGKTPMVRHVVGWLLQAGFDPCIAMRGYAAGPSGRSDEALEYAARLEGVPVVAQPNRIEGLIQLFATARGRQVDCIVLDDGFQHRKIARQCDVVLLDATRSPFLDKALPAGLLREPTSSLGRAHAVVVTHAASVSEQARRALIDAARAAAPSAVLAACEHRWGGLVDQHGVERDVASLAGQRVFAACAIGNPGPFLAACRAAVRGGVLASMVLRDHDPYAPRTVDTLIAHATQARADAIVVTEKDWAKLARVASDRWHMPVLRPRLELEFVLGEDDLRALVLDAAKAGQALRSLMDLPELDGEAQEESGASPSA